MGISLKSDTFKNALASKPNIVFIMLELMTVEQSTVYFYNEFINNYKDLISQFKNLPTQPRMVLLLPITPWVKDPDQIYNSTIKYQIIHRMQNVMAYQTNCKGLH